jgi:hypothetical protein
MGKTYPTKVDWWVAVLLVFPVIGGGIALISGLINGTPSMLWIGAGSLVLYLLLLWGLVLPMLYAIGEDGFRLRAGRMNLHVPFDRLIKAEMSRNPLSSPALSLKRINIEYKKPNGRETFVLISPPDRERFLADLVAASNRHRLVDGKVIEM